MNCKVNDKKYVSKKFARNICVSYVHIEISREIWYRYGIFGKSSVNDEHTKVFPKQEDAVN